MAMRKVSVGEYEAVKHENDLLREFAFAMIRRYEGRLQRLKDECDHDFEICEKYRQELSVSKKKSILR